MLHVLLAIVHKELLDGVRDRRAVLSAFSFPLFAPLLIAYVVTERHLIRGITMGSFR